MTGYVDDNSYSSPTFGQYLSLRVDGGFNAISINPSGRDIVLAGRQGLYIVDLDDPFSQPRYLQHRTPWQVADVQWSPHPAKPNWVVSTSNQKAIIWNLERNSSNAIEYSLHGHFRAITDINFNREHPDILATCSLDTYVHAWDLRSPSRPFYTTSDWISAASQVKWNFKDSNILASSHGNNVCIWDLRNGSVPLKTLKGHTGGVNSVDFNRNKKTELMTCSNDGYVKFWDYSKQNDPCIKSVAANFPIWRGRYLPFGDGYCIMPMVGGDNSVYLMKLSSETDDSDNSDQIEPVSILKGHNDTVLDFIWRSRYHSDSVTDDREFQMVTWSKDNDLRLWPMSNYIYDKVNFVRGKRLEEKLPNYEYVSYNKEPDSIQEVYIKNKRLLKEHFTSRIKENNDQKHINWIAGVRMNDLGISDSLYKDRKFQNFGEEVSAIGHKFPKLGFEKISVSTGDLVITLRGPWVEEDPNEYIFIRLIITIPPEYPSPSKYPKFTIEENSKLTKTKMYELNSMLKEICKKYTNLNFYCLEPCIRFVLGETINLDSIEELEAPLLNYAISDHIGQDDISSLTSDSGFSDYFDESEESDQELGDKENLTNRIDKLNSFQNLNTLDSTPIPNQCGMTWSPDGQLICFFSDHVYSGNNKLVTNKYKTLALAEDNNIVNDDLNLENDAQRPEAPKRYVDTIVTNTSTTNDKIVTDDESDSADSINSISHDWDNILRNDSILRTHIPNFESGFYKVFGSPSASEADPGATSKTQNTIIFQDYSHLIPDKRQLALEYRFIDGTGEEMTMHNASVAGKYGYDAISHCWQILSDYIISQKLNDPYSVSWDSNPLGLKWFIKELLTYFEKEKNLQMLALISCIVASQNNSSKVLKSDKSSGEPLPANVESIISFNNNSYENLSKLDRYSQYSDARGDNPSEFHFRTKRYDNIDNMSIQSDDYFNFRTHSEKLKRKGMWGNDSSAATLAQSITPTLTTSQKIPEIKVELLNDDILDAIDNRQAPLFDDADVIKMKSYIFQYSKLLFHWGLTIEHARILKVNIDNKAIPSTKELQYDGFDTCWINDTETKKNCLHNCNFCDLKVTRNIFICGSCQHLMHTTCAQEWWLMEDECPSGCGCRCPEVFDAT
ncbi:hypothetical protein TPHA_0C01050 [Tetrapisispora phaffii CBS 4417]|uniref:RWD domain-containing protein n=1 Tax=Tetrapisispora phaffii (strain ATCC 24235 / CBS 4417 / NBRC 1672 / NRRL Y-8282 / UCD 70-5) TaxID=1071381 RepID=G8BR85_TETPH|nr:hypothetical protein TPHA_0C01050 [Tetrapisispora phaffii CBS 4417]CCE62261.1 hypothetical protein TPHA_0C01050 [Tetrapisispora phaffii CBS 4417]